MENWLKAESIVKARHVKRRSSRVKHVEQAAGAVAQIKAKVKETADVLKTAAKRA